MLTALQYHDVYVEGDVHARSILCHSGTLVATGQIKATDVIAFEVNEEGGVLHGAGCKASLLCRFGSGGPEWAVSNQDKKAEIREISDAPELKALKKVLQGLRVSRDWQGVRELVTAGRSAELLRALGPALAEASQRAPRTRAKGKRRPHPTCKPFFLPELETGKLVCGINVTSEGHVYLCGGLGMNMGFVSTDRGETFAPFRVPPGTGLRGILVERKATFVCGVQGLFARSMNAGKTFERIDVGTTKTLHSVLRGDGALWCTGDDGAFRSDDDGTTWKRLKGIKGEVIRPQDSVHGVLLPTDKGRLYICRDGKIQSTPLATSEALWAACASPAGTILVVGDDGAIERSEDGGKSFQRSDAPDHVSFQNVVHMDDGRFVAVGDPASVLTSVDDGRSFESAPMAFTAFMSRYMIGLARFDDRVLVGSDNGYVIELSDRKPLEQQDNARARRKLKSRKRPTAT